MFSYFEDLGHRYLVKVKLKNLKKLLISQDWQPVVHQPGWECCEFQHCCGDWDRSRRFVAVWQIKAGKAESAQGELLGQKPEYDYFCYVTTETLSPWEIHKTYGKRATCETWIEENKNLLYKTEWDAWLAVDDCVNNRNPVIKKQTFCLCGRGCHTLASEMVAGRRKIMLFKGI